MKYIFWTIRLCLLTLCVGFLHYTLPQHDTVRITGTDIIRRDIRGYTQIFFAHNGIGEAGVLQNYDLRLISAVRPDGAIRVYRNEDTGWSWPPYFKFGTSNIQAQATDLISTKNDDTVTWVLLRHYGWRSELLSIYPNVVRMRAIDEPSVRVIPWQNSLTLFALLALFLVLRARWNRFWAVRVEPIVEEASFELEDRSTSLKKRFDQFWNWLRNFFKGA